MDTVLRSFKLRDGLNPEIWEENKMKPEIRSQLLQIAKLFVDYIDVENLEVEDITLTGSMSNYNWSEYSDIDLHVLVDYTKIADDPEFAANFLAAKKALFNNKYDFKTKGYEVELYAQDINEKHASTGVYSVLFNKWVTEPKPMEGRIDYNKIKEKSNVIINIIKKLENGDLSGSETRDIIQKIKKKLSNYRKSGLSREGELSAENLTFKYLRRGGWLDRLSELSIEAMNDELTVEDFSN